MALSTLERAQATLETVLYDKLQIPLASRSGTLDVMNDLLTIILSLAILPSFNALIEYDSTFLIPGVGPPHILKLSAPLILLFVWLRRDLIPPRVRWLLCGAWAISVPCILIATARCEFPVSVLRELSVISLGLLAALAWWVLPRENQSRVFKIWIAILVITTAFEFFFPNVYRASLFGLFDYKILSVSDFEEVGHQTLNGIYGRQSLAKLLTWLPWLLAAFWSQDRRTSKFLMAALPVLAIGTMAAAQRGALFAIIGGAIGWSAYHYRFTKNFQHFKLLGMEIIGLFLGIFTLIPRVIWEVRFKAMLGIEQLQSVHTKAAVANQTLRIQLFKFYSSVIAHSPFGNVCIPVESFSDISPGARPHSHNLFLQQFIHGGWLWGGVHLLLWIFALRLTWQRKDLVGCYLFSGLVALIITGLFDHPWFVLNHSLILWIYLILAYSPAKEFQRATT